MRAVRVESFGGLALPLRDVAAPGRLGPDEILIDVHTAPINFADVLVACGKYQFRPQLPFTPCGECSGVVAAVGEGVSRFRPGDRVAVLGPRRTLSDTMHVIGTLSEQTVADVDNLMPVPESLTLEQAALFRSNYETAAYALHLAGLEAGETLLVLGAGGGTGFAAITIAKALGARVIGSASREDRRELASRAGADFVIDTQAEDWRQQVNEITAGHGVDCVYDPVGGAATEKAFRALRFQGRHLVIGFASGTIPSLPVNLALMKGASLIGANLLRGLREEPEVAAQTRASAWELLAAGKLTLPPVARRYGLEQASAAMAAVAGAECAGRVVVSVNPALDRARRLP